MDKIKIAIAGLGNCASSLIQGIYYYKNIRLLSLNSILDFCYKNVYIYTSITDNTLYWR